MRGQRNKNCSLKTNSRFDLNACETVTSQCQERIPVLSSYWPTHFMMCDHSSTIPTIIVCPGAVQANKVELISRVIWHCVSHLSGNTLEWIWSGTVGVGLPLMFGLLPGWIIILWRMELLFQCWVRTSNWKCSTNELSNLYWEYFHTGRQIIRGKNNFRLWPNLFWQWWGDISHQHKRGWNF